MESHTLIDVATIFETGLSILCGVALLVLAATAVRQRRPNSAGLLIGAGAAVVAVELISAVGFRLLEHVNGEEPLRFYAVAIVFISILRTGAWSVLLLGIWRLARPEDPSRDA